VEYADLAAIGEEALKETSFLTSLRNVDAIIHVLRAFEDDTIPMLARSIRCATSATWRSS